MVYNWYYIVHTHACSFPRDVQISSTSHNIVAYESKGTAMATKSKIARREVPLSGPRHETQITRAKNWNPPIGRECIITAFTQPPRRADIKTNHYDTAIISYERSLPSQIVKHRWLSVLMYLIDYFVELKQKYTTQNAWPNLGRSWRRLAKRASARAPRHGNMWHSRWRNGRKFTGKWQRLRILTQLAITQILRTLVTLSLALFQKLLKCFIRRASETNETCNRQSIEA